ncbi:hypothetical protein [Mycobacterium tuberculosis]|uniref:hypothetical protein n=1 Tax=Mycobacterium tuberculosis TaxID=1773 RepID=UPI00272B7283|nr:hypothetical protein [Mycobacterium tuberculosis]
MRAVRQFPNITVVDLSATLAQVQRVLDQVSRAVEFLFGFTLAAGLVALFAAVTATREERAREYAVMRAVGPPTSRPCARPQSPGLSTARWVRQFPNITVVDLSATLAQVQRVLDQVSRAVEFLLYPFHLLLRGADLNQTVSSPV